jgi:hypothetical protein
MDEKLETGTAKPARALRTLLGQPRIRIGAVLALAVTAGVIIWAIAGRAGSTSTSQPAAGPLAKPIAPVALSASGLRTIARAVSQPIYWAGPKPGYRYELSRTTAGSVFIRYLPPGVKAGAPEAKYLLIATYRYPDARQALTSVAHGKALDIRGGGTALVDDTYRKSVHVAYPGVPYQVEVYDPSPAVSRNIALSGAVRPVR